MAEWSPQRVRAEAQAQARLLVDTLSGMLNTPEARRAVAAQVGETPESAAEFYAFLQSPEAVESTAAVFEGLISSGGRPKRILTPDEAADPYADPLVLGTILRDTFPALRDRICAAV